MSFRLDYYYFLNGNFIKEAEAVQEEYTEKLDSIIFPLWPVMHQDKLFNHIPAICSTIESMKRSKFSDWMKLDTEVSL